MRRRHAVQPLSGRSLLRDADMAAAEDDHRTPLPAPLRFIVSQQDIVGVRRFSGMAAYRQAVIAEQRRDEHRQRGIMDCQPAGLACETVRRHLRCVLHAIQRDTDGKTAAHPRLRFHGDIAIHHADQLFTDRQAKAGALEVSLHAGPHLEEGIEQAQHLFRRDPLPGIADADLQIIPRTLDVQDNTAGVGELNRIAQQVRDHLLQAHRVAGHLLRDIRLDKTVQTQLLAYHQRQIVSRDMVHHFARGKLPRLDLQLLRLDFREIENIADDFQQQAGRVVHRRHQAINALRQGLSLQQIEVTDDAV